MRNENLIPPHARHPAPGDQNPVRSIPTPRKTNPNHRSDSASHNTVFPNEATNPRFQFKNRSIHAHFAERSQSNPPPSRQHGATKTNTAQQFQPDLRKTNQYRPAHCLHDVQVSVEVDSCGERSVERGIKEGQ